MKTVLFGIFAHPEDESFGPCGTLLKAIEAGFEVHLITLPVTEAGKIPTSSRTLGKRAKQSGERQLLSTTGSKPQICH